ncbi:unnamed protein product [Acanthoscelides obtectus]|uniref:Uncharacterized protein n=1 Tax=Acanthoscelides obtectus TaxID=200917 RepID=A0A9P0PV37_ACAOB|nr:unnamed protein product [Acanthoscelides obtectus]CAK1624293.1 hypothetical protein AOBTE_LOCUS2476 [Acanthoscelides obtectus]
MQITTKCQLDRSPTQQRNEDCLFVYCLSFYQLITHCYKLLLINFWYQFYFIHCKCLSMYVILK